MLKLGNISGYLILVCGFFICIFQNIPDRAADIGTPKKVQVLKDAWEDEAYGEISEYAVFLKENFFKKDFPEYVLRHPWPFSQDFIHSPSQTYVKEYDSNYYFLGGYIGWFLFPIKIERTNNYNYYLDEKEFRVLNECSSLSIDSQFIGSDVKKRFYLLKQLKSEDYKEWNIYFYPAEDVVHVFILPVNWLKQIEIN